VRLALGASRRPLLAHQLTESVALAVAGGLGGLVLAHWTIRLIGLLDLPITVDFSLDYRVFGFALGLSLVTGIAFGLVPALKATAVDLVRALRDEGPTLSTGRRWLTAKNMLLTVQVAVSMVLLAATGLLIRSFVEASGQEMGFALDGVAMLETDARYAGYDAAGSEAVYNELVERIRAIPGVEAATRSLGAPVEDFLGSRALIIDGYEPADGEQSVPVQWMMAGPDYFETLQIPILFGRGFEQLDRQDSPRVAIINETMAQRYFGTRNAVGRRFRYDGESESVEVVGVAANILQELVASEPIQARFYRTWTQAEIPATTVIARGSIDAGILLAAMHRELIALDPTLPEIRARTMAAHVEDSTRMGRFLIGALGGLALLGMALAGVGLYAVVSYGVTNRFREIGIRMALGAKPAQVVRIVARDVSVLVGVGVGLGIAMTVGGIVTLGVLAANASDVGNIIQPSANYPWTVLVVALVMLGVGLLAAYLPARRAATVNPLEALRHS
jgi:putative ABC transport system permease protein